LAVFIILKVSMKITLLFLISVDTTGSKYTRYTSIPGIPSTWYDI
jgi:hypothetical protein